MKRKQEKRYQFADSHGSCYSTDGRHIGCLHMTEYAYKVFNSLRSRVSHTCLQMVTMRGWQSTGADHMLVSVQW
jgi:hypothetical protein